MSNHSFSMKNSYGGLAGQKSNLRSNFGDISMSMKNAPMPSNNLGSGASMGSMPLNLGMTYNSKRNAARASNVSMSASFNISGSTGNNRVIENYQDMSMGASRRAAAGGWTSAANVNAF
jgi:hypothetical protein